MRFLSSGFVCLLLICCPLRLGRAQSPPAAVQPQDHFFSGTITVLEEDKITVSRTVLGSKQDTHTFLITPDTRIEGKPKLKSRVTVRFIADDDGDRAVHIIVRPSSTPKKAI